MKSQLLFARNVSIIAETGAQPTRFFVLQCPNSKSRDRASPL